MRWATGTVRKVAQFKRSDKIYNVGRSEAM